MVDLRIAVCNGCLKIYPGIKLDKTQIHVWRCDKCTKQAREADSDEYGKDEVS